MKSSRNSRPADTALVTGASSGIGLELCRLLAADGHQLVLVARDPEKLAPVSKELSERFGARVISIARDLTNPEAPVEIFRELERRSMSIDVLVNNAGYGLRGFFARTDPVLELEMIQVNVRALTHLTKLSLPHMLKQRQGKILNVASTAAFQPGPLMAVYYASKAFVLSFSEAIANELGGSGVTVTTLCPGATETGFQKRAGMEGTRLFRGRNVMDAQTVARLGYRGLMRGKRLVIPGLWNRLLVQSVRIGPRALVLKIARALQEGG